MSIKQIFSFFRPILKLYWCDTLIYHLVSRGIGHNKKNYKGIFGFPTIRGTSDPVSQNPQKFGYFGHFSSWCTVTLHNGFTPFGGRTGEIVNV